jgi:excisionase family DNA binding protein
VRWSDSSGALSASWSFFYFPFAMEYQMSDRQQDVVHDGFGTVDAVKEFLSVGRSTVYGLMENGQLPYTKIGRARRIPWLAVRQFAANSLLDRSGMEVSNGERNA